MALLFLAGCSSSDLGGILGGGNSPQPANYELRGTVDYVDASGQFVALRDVSGLSSGSTARVYYDAQTTVSYQGQSYRPDALERGDQISARVDESGNRLLASSMTVLYDTSGGTVAGSSAIRGTVRSIDSSRRQIELARSGTLGDTLIVEYDTNTPVNFQNRQYRPEDLERGDEVDVRVQNLGSGRLLAESIDVIRTIGTGMGTATPSGSVIRGTVGYIDTSRRTIELQQATSTSRFTPGTSSNLIVQYDTNTSVEFQGRTYAVTSLDRGDVVDVYTRNVGGSSIVADRVLVVRDVNTLR